ncbi:alcohol dehydrogenase catalytic domain-containing protein, partial [Salmonella enterica subsp. enterica serovar Virginia]|nr:alcohol dehydrogenase catalytic domain-containing protein [Salmonella enterica subsp. enterica serovar Virginia]
MGVCGADHFPIPLNHNRRERFGKPFELRTQAGCFMLKYPRVIGHEFFGVIDAVGDNVNHDRIGERVSVDPVISCGHCY